MIRKMLATTALVALMAGPAVVATGATAAEPTASMKIETFGTLDTKDSQGYLASELMGRSVYTSTADDAERIGEIDDALVGMDGSIKAVILGVGGFLGMGEKNVAVDFNRLKLEKTADDGYVLVSKLSKEELESAPGYEASEKAAMDDDKLSADKTAAAIDKDMKKESTANNVPATSTVAAVDADATTTAKTPENSRESFMEGKTKLSSEQIEADKLVGAWAYDSDFNHIGEVGDVLVTANGKLDAMIIDVGGFLGLGEKHVAMSFKDVDLYRDEDNSLFAAVPYTEEQLEAATEYEEKTFAKQSDKMLLTPTPIN